jgi:hypothetical protein
MTATEFPKQADVESVYTPIQYSVEGEPTERWKGLHLISMGLPYYMKLAWAPHIAVRRAYVHRAVAKSLTSALGNVREQLGLDKIAELGLDHFAGAFRFGVNNFGHLANDSYGIVFRIRPPKSGYVPQAVLDIFEAEGWSARGGLKPGAEAVFEAVSK